MLIARASEHVSSSWNPLTPPTHAGEHYQLFLLRPVPFPIRQAQEFNTHNHNKDWIWVHMCHTALFLRWCATRSSTRPNMSRLVGAKGFTLRVLGAWKIARFSWCGLWTSLGCGMLIYFCVLPWLWVFSKHRKESSSVALCFSTIIILIWLLLSFTRPHFVFTSGETHLRLRCWIRQLELWLVLCQETWWPRLFIVYHCFRHCSADGPIEEMPDTWCHSTAQFVRYYSTILEPRKTWCCSHEESRRKGTLGKWRSSSNVDAQGNGWCK